jgi:hypothetical protein
MREVEKKLEKQGYNFSGVYSFYKEEAMDRADKYRGEGYLVRVVFEPSSKYARGHHSGGWSVHIKATKKLQEKLEAEKLAREEEKKASLRIAKEKLSTLNGEELFNMIKDISGKDEETIIKNIFKGYEGAIAKKNDATYTSITHPLCVG